MKHTRQFAALALTLSLALALSACGGSPAASAVDSTLDTPPVSEPAAPQLPEGALVIAEQYNADGGNALVVDLPKEGITGNSHFMFQERNNAEIADYIEAWIQANVEQ